MSNIASPLFLILICATVLAQSPSSNLTSERRQNVERLADIYKMPKAEAVQKYETILRSDHKTAPTAAIALRKQGAFELLVAAFGDVKDPSMKGFLLEEILNKREFSPAACALLLDQLDAFNGP